MSRQPVVPKLSDLIHTTTSRRSFLTSASALGVGAALTACRKDEPERTATPPAAPAAPPAASPVDFPPHQTHPGAHNRDSRLDSTLHHGAHPSSATGAISPADVPFHRYDPTLPPVLSGNTKKSTSLHAKLRCASDPISSWLRGLSRATCRVPYCTCARVTRSSSRSPTTDRFRTPWIFTPRRSIPRLLSAP